MRISDWSSDVCSSDLEVVQKLGEAMSRMAAGDFSVSMDDLPEGYSKLSDDFNAMAAQMRSILGAVANSAERTHTGSSETSSAANDLEIGSASCRERVSQYVYSTVGAVSIKKKK